MDGIEGLSTEEVEKKATVAEYFRKHITDARDAIAPSVISFNESTDNLERRVALLVQISQIIRTQYDKIMSEVPVFLKTLDEDKEYLPDENIIEDLKVLPIRFLDEITDYLAAELSILSLELFRYFQSQFALEITNEIEAIKEKLDGVLTGKI